MTRGLISAATASIAVVWRYAAFIFTGSAFLTGLLDTAYTLAFAAASYWLTTRGAALSGRTSIVASGLVSATVTMVMALLIPLHQYLWLLLPAMVIGAVTGVNYPAWYSQLRRGRDSNELYGQIGPYEAFRVAAILGGTAGGGLVAHLLGLQPASSLIAVVFAAGGGLALTFPRPNAVAAPHRKQPGNPAHADDPVVYHRVRLLFGLLAALQLMLAPIVAVTPVLAVEGVDGGVAQVGVLFALYATGSVLQVFTTRAAARGVGVRVLVTVPLTLMLTCAVLAAVRDTMVSAGLLMVSFGFGVASIGTLINAEIQSAVHESVRDRHVSTLALIFSIPLAIGSGLWGLAADFLAVPTIATITTLVTAAIAALLLVSWRRVSGRWGKSR
ncbi:hypothetical protein MGAST_09745 [Mycobacterium gastri 'Wayne']|nr:hypothetical protein MGAST_09745 [Mycobacterium gastri 'Wayne']